MTDAVIPSDEIKEAIEGHSVTLRVIAVLLVKGAACGLAVFAWKGRRTRLLWRANLFFGLCVG